MVCSCCKAIGKSKRGCSCTGGKSHQCLLGAVVMDQSSTTEEACDKVLKYVLDRQTIQHQKSQGLNWFKADASSGFHLEYLLTKKHSPPRNEDGFMNQKFLGHADMLSDKIPNDQHWAALAAVFATFMNSKFLDKVCSTISTSKKPGSWLENLPTMIAEFEIEHEEVPLAAFWGRAAVQVGAMKSKTMALLKDLKHDSEILPKLLKTVSVRYAKQLAFITKVYRTVICSSEEAYIKSIGGTLIAGIVGEHIQALSSRGFLVPDVFDDGDEVLATAFTGFWNGMAAAFQVAVEDLNVDHCKHLRNEAVTRSEWISKYEKVGG